MVHLYLKKRITFGNTNSTTIGGASHCSNCTLISMNHRLGSPLFSIFDILVVLFFSFWHLYCSLNYPSIELFCHLYCSLNYPYIESWCKLFNGLEVHVSEQLTQSASPPCVNFSETFTSLSIKSYLNPLPGCFLFTSAED